MKLQSLISEKKNQFKYRLSILPLKISVKAAYVFKTLKMFNL